MACPACDHTMHCLRTDRLWWCPRCGTIKERVSYSGQNFPALPYWMTPGLYSTEMIERIVKRDLKVAKALEKLDTHGRFARGEETG